MSSLFASELEVLLNRHSMESPSNTPDFILAKYLIDCLATYNKTIVDRANWYGRMDKPGQSATEEKKP
jgi:hypothetical protein